MARSTRTAAERRYSAIARPRRFSGNHVLTGLPYDELTRTGDAAWVRAALYIVARSECLTARHIADHCEVDASRFRAFSRALHVKKDATELIGTSGTHYNPAVTTAVFLRGRCAAADVLPYWIAQFVGAGVAAVPVLYVKRADAVCEEAGL